MRNQIKDNVNEPIAIIGFGCRLPGDINSPSIFWESICNGIDAITDIPEDRWNISSYYDEDKEKHGKMYVKRGGFLKNVRKFEPGFFGISPKEAAIMDPQQRLLLEVSWEALEDGGIPPETVRGSKTGVYIGLFMHDFENIQSNPMERINFNPHSATGNSTTISASRISYVYDFKGPCLIIDTACSSSLVAVHLACKGLHNRDCNMAVVGGVNLILKPEMHITLCKGNFLSPDGKCKSFDESANGYVRSEGVGVAILKRLSDAIASNDTIYAVIKGTSSNQDGKSNGLTVPALSSQVQLIKDALEISDLKPNHIQYVEAHGTGTSVGDPIEANAIGTVLAEGRSDDDRVIIGSVKSNIGHTESAAGITGLMKAALMVKHGIIPKNLHFKNPNPNIEFDKLKLRVPTKTEKWYKKGDLPRIACVNSFGFGGSNAHVILEEYVPSENNIPTKNFDVDHLNILTISANSESALKLNALEYAEYLSNTQNSLNDICYSCAHHKGLHSNRLCLLGKSKKEMIELLEAFTHSESRSSIIKTKDTFKEHQIAFVFSGMGPQWWGMGRVLYEKEPVFREMIVKCDSILRTLTKEWSLIEELSKDENSSRINETQIAQPCIFAIQVGLNALWRYWGIKPKAIIGHSVGEVAASYASGSLTLEDATKVIYYRSLLQSETAGMGSMLAVGLSLEQAEEIVAVHKNISIAAVNSASSLTLAGDENTLIEISNILIQKGIFARFLKVEVPYHSPIMDKITPRLKNFLNDIQPQTCHTDLISSVTGDLIDGTAIDGNYWCANVRQPVYFQKGFEKLLSMGVNIFIEISAHPVLAMSMQENISNNKSKCLVLHSLRRMEDDLINIYGSLTNLYTSGYNVNWKLTKIVNGKFVKLPLYKWMREEFWTETEYSEKTRIGTLSEYSYTIIDEKTCPLLGYQIKTQTNLWQNEIDLNRIGYLKDHKVYENIVFPGAAYVEMFLNVAKITNKSQTIILEDFEIFSPLFLDSKSNSILQVFSSEKDSLSIYSKNNSDSNEWNKHSTTKISFLNKLSSPEPMKINELLNKMDNNKDIDNIYSIYSKKGLNYGLCFQGIKTLYSNGSEALGKISINDQLLDDLANYELHPVILDNAFQIMASIKTDGTYLPVKINRLIFYKKPQAHSWCYSKISFMDDDYVSGDIYICDDDGNVCVVVEELKCNVVKNSMEKNHDSITNNLYIESWICDFKTSMSDRKDLFNKMDDIVYEVKSDAEENAIAVLKEDMHSSIKYWMDRISCGIVLDLMENLSVNMGDTRHYSLEIFIEEYGILPKYEKLLNRCISILHEDGYVKKDQGLFQFTGILEKIDFRKEISDMVINIPNSFIIADMLYRCGSDFYEFLTGKKEALDYVFPQNSNSIELLYWCSPTFNYYADIASNMVSKVIQGISANRKIKILEVGAGTGSLTSRIMNIIQGEVCEYCFTDVSQFFINIAKNKFVDYDFIEYKIFDIEKDPLEQGLESSYFDIVLCSDAIHATADVRKSLLNLKKVLTPYGMIIFIEQCGKSRWEDMVFGLFNDWWKYEDYDIRPDHPLMHIHTWEKVITEVGFAKAYSVHENKKDGSNPEQVVLIAVNDYNFEEKISDLSSINNNILKRPWIIFCDEIGFAEEIRELAEKSGIIITTVTKGESYIKNGSYITIRHDSLDQYNKLLTDICCDLTMSPVILNFWTIGKETTKDSCQGLEKIVNSTCMYPVYMYQALFEKNWKLSPVIWNITSNSQATDENSEISVEQSAVWGLLRVMRNENTDIKIHIADVSSEIYRYEMESLFIDICYDSNEDEIAYRKLGRYLRRVEREVSTELVLPYEKKIAFMQKGKRNTSDIKFFEVPFDTPHDDEVLVEIKAIGLNGDDLKMLDTNSVFIPSSLHGNIRFGSECSGIVASVGKDVKKFKAGDHVMGICNNGATNFAVIHQDLLVNKPDTVGFEEAATIPYSYTAAHLILNNITRLQKGEKILIHNATSPFGLACIKIAKIIGADVYTTENSDIKINFLKAIGGNCIGNSNSIEFEKNIFDINKNGIDVVIDYLNFSRANSNYKILKPFKGRMVNYVDSDAYNRIVPLKGNNIAISTFNFNKFLSENIALSGEALHEVCEMVEFKGIPYNTYSINSISHALNTLKSDLTYGKIVLNMSPRNIKIEYNKTDYKFNKDSTYLITGGLGGFGSSCALWMAKNNARNIVLIGRNGAKTPKAKSVVKELMALNVNVIVKSLDITDENAVLNMITEIKNELPPIKGVLHAAMVLEDTFLTSMDETKMKRATNPKILGAWNLHRFTSDIDLDFFISFSSVSSMIGNPDQGNYCAGNMFLDVLSEYRKNLGKNTTSIRFGPISGAGYLEGKEQIMKHLSKTGINALTLDQAWDTISYALQKGTQIIAAAPLDWETYFYQNSFIRNSSRFSYFKQYLSNINLRDITQNRKQGELCEQEIKEILQKDVADVLGIAAYDLKSDQPLDRLGFDSLMAVELVAKIEKSLGAKIPKISFLKSGMNVDEIEKLVRSKAI